MRNITTYYSYNLIRQSANTQKSAIRDELLGGDGGGLNGHYLQPTVAVRLRGRC